MLGERCMWLRRCVVVAPAVVMVVVVVVVGMCSGSWSFEVALVVMVGSGISLASRM